MADVNFGDLMDAGAALRDRPPHAFFLDMHPSTVRAWFGDGTARPLTLQVTKTQPRGSGGVAVVEFTPELDAVVRAATGVAGKLDNGQTPQELRLAAYVGRLAEALRVLEGCKPGVFLTVGAHGAMTKAKATARRVLAELTADGHAAGMNPTAEPEKPEQPTGQSADVLDALRTRFDPRVIQPDEVSRRAAAEIERLRARLSQANGDADRANKRAADATTAEAAAVRKLAQLRAEVEAVLGAVPDAMRVDVREGGGPDDLAATLAVTVANVVHMHDVAQATVNERTKPAPDVASLQRHAAEAEREADRARDAERVARQDVEHWKREAQNWQATAADLTTEGRKGADRYRELDAERERVAQALYGAQAGEHAARGAMTLSEGYRDRYRAALVSVADALRVNEPIPGVVTAAAIAAARAILRDVLADMAPADARKPASPTVTAAAEWKGPAATLTVTVNGRDERGSRLGFAEPGRPPVFFLPGDTARVVDRDGIALDIHYSGDLSPRAVPAGGPTAETMARLRRLEVAIADAVRWLRDFDRRDGRTPEDVLKALRALEGANPTTTPRQEDATPAAVLRALEDAQNRVRDLEAAIGEAGYAVQQMAGCVRLQHIGPEGDDGDDDDDSRNSATDWPPSSPLAEDEDDEDRARIVELERAVDGYRVLLNFSELRCSALARAMHRAEEPGFVTKVTEAVKQMTEHVRGALLSAGNGSPQAAERFRGQALEWARHVAELVGSQAAGFNPDAYRLPPHFTGP